MKRIVSALLAVLLLFSVFSFSAFADSSHSLFCPRCNTFQLQGVVTEHAYCPKCGGSLFEFGGGDGRGSGAGRRPGAASIEVPKQYYTSPSAGGSGTSYNGGTTSYYSVMNTQNNTLNFTTYNQTTNNYTQNNYTYNNYTYNNEYNYYTYNIDNHNYYVTNNYTYVTVVYPDGTQDENGNDNYESVDIYYELPDGRSSYNLSVEDIWGVYFTYNVKSCDEVKEDDGVTLGLFHFDGDLKNSAALDNSLYLTSVVTTFDKAVFDGGLLQTSQTAANRGITIKSNSVLSEFKTIEFWVFYSSAFYRYNNSTQTSVNATAYPNFLYSQYPVPTGTWVHIALCRNTASEPQNGQIAGPFTVFINGVKQSKPLDYTFDGFANNCRFENSTTGTTYWSSVIGFDELRISNEVLYTGDFVPSSQPFDTNSVLVKPSNPIENDIVVMSNVPVSDYRIGGVRPTFPVLGYTYIYLEDDVVKNVQQYQGNGWVSVDSFIFRNGEWIELKNFNMKDLEFVEPETPSPTPTPNPSECSHEYVVDNEKVPTCTVNGSITYKCKLCGDSYTDDVPALGHDWQVAGTGGSTVSPSPSPVNDSSEVLSDSEILLAPLSTESPSPTQLPATEPEYTLYRCSRCGMEYKDYEGSGPPSGGDEDEEEGGILGMLKKLLGTIVNGIVSILETVLGGVIKLLVSLIDELVSGLTAVIDGLISSMGQLANFGGTFKDFFGQVFPFILSEIVMLLGFSLSLSIILMIIKFFRG